MKLQSPLRELLSCALLASLCLCVCSNGAAAASSVKIIVFNNSNTPKLKASVDVAEGTKEFVEGPPNTYAIDVPLESEVWFTDVTVHIEWLNGTDDQHVNQTLSLRFTKNSPPEFTIPAYYSPKINGIFGQFEADERDKVVKSREQMFRDFFIIGQATDLVKNMFKDNPSADLTLRAAKAWFWASVNLTEKDKFRIVLLNSDAKGLLLARLPSDQKSDFEARAIRAESSFWKDLDLLDGMLQSHDCADAKTLIADLGGRKDDQAKDVDSDPYYLAQYGTTPSAFNERTKREKAQCSGGT